MKTNAKNNSSWLTNKLIRFSKLSKAIQISLAASTLVVGSACTRGAITSTGTSVRSPSSASGFVAGLSKVVRGTRASVTQSGASLSVNPLLQGGSQLIKVSIQSTTNLSSLTAEIRIVDGLNKTIHSQAFQNVSLLAGVAKPLESTYQSAATVALGSYKVQVGVWSSTAQQYLFQDIATYMVQAAPVVAAPVVTAPATTAPVTADFKILLSQSTISSSVITAGQTQAIRTSLVANQNAGSLYASVRIYDAQQAQIAMKNFENLSLVANVAKELQFDYVTPSTLLTGRYTVQVGVWNSAWATYLYETIATFDVSGTSAPAPAPAPAIEPTPILAPAPTTTTTTTTTLADGTLPAPVLASQSNVLTNGGFEDGNTAWNYHWGNAAVGISQPRTGRKGLEVSPNGGFSTQFLINRLNPNETYRVDLYAKLGVSTEDGHFGVTLKNATGGVISDRVIKITTSTYQMYTMDFTVSSTVTDASVYFYKNGGTSKLYVDDVNIYSVSNPVAALYAQPAATPAGGLSYPFGSHKVPYKYGIKVTSATQAAQDLSTKSFYDRWKPYALSTSCGNYHVKFNRPGFATVSEGVAYGMMMTAVMAGHDPEAKTIFDGLFRFARAFPAYEQDSALMEWRVSDTCQSSGQGWSALDGDLDIAMGLLLADKQWGSAGAINYMAEAVRTINAMKLIMFKRDGQVGASISRTSDYMIGHFRAFKKATGDVFWDVAINRAMELLEFTQANHAPLTGLVPDFLVGFPGVPKPSPGGMIESDTEGDFGYNGCRTPWRLASDYIFTGDERVKRVNMKIMNFLQTASGGNAERVFIYKLDGTPIASWSSPSFYGPTAAGALMDPSQQTFLNNLWNHSARQTLFGYYDNELLFLGMLVASGNWWTP